jgi:dTDP-4-amino-4,6-dideoxygalactose transaminase
MINVFGSKVGEEEINSVTETMKTQWMGFGKKVEEFETLFQENRKLNNFLLVDSGSNALFMAVHLLDLPKGSEIIIPTFTWVSCAQAILLAGHIPVFCDVDLDSHNTTVELIKPHITNKTGAIMVVHYAGKPVDMDPIIDLGYPVIEDAAHAVDSYYKGKLCGSIGDIGIYSFDSVKNITTIEGGGITFRDESKYERAKILRYCGIGKSGFDAAISGSQNKNRWWEYNISEPFIKMLPTNVGAAVGIEQLKKINDLQSHRKMIWDFYQDSFKDVNWIKRPINHNADETHSYFTYVITVDLDRDKLAKYLLDNGVYTTLRYHPLHMNPLYNSNKELPNSITLNETSLSIPIHPNLPMEDVVYIVDKIKEFGNLNQK